MKESGWKVYVHINKLNNKKYVGITSKDNPNHRWNSGRGYAENPHFYSAITKYGWDEFEHIILYDNLTATQAKETERKLISMWKTQNPDYGYNMTSGGDGTPNYYPSEETRRKKAIASMRENLSEETLRRRSESLRGRKFTEEHKRRIGDANSKPVEMYSLDGEYIRTFCSAHKAEVELGIRHSHISQCCHNKRRSTGGYIWKFA